MRAGHIGFDLRMSQFLVSGRSAVRFRSPALAFRTVILTACLPRARWLSSLALFGLGEFGPRGVSHRVSQGTLALAGRMQVDQHSTWAVVAHPRHEFPRIGTRSGGELVAGMPQIMKVDPGQPDCSERGEPDATAEVRIGQRRASRTSERKRSATRKRGEVLTQVRRDQIGESDDAATSP